MEGVVRWHENGDMAVGEPEVDDHERSGRGDQKQRAGGREVVRETKTEIVHVVGECGGLCQLATVSQGIDFFLKRWKPVDGACASDRRAWIRQMIGLFLNIGRAC